MRFLKILGMVVALHVVLFTIFLLSPGCQSNPTTPAPTPATADAGPATSTLEPAPVDQTENWSSQRGTNPVSSTISSAPLGDSSAMAGDASRSTPQRPANPAGYVSTGDREPPALNPPPTRHVIRAGDNLGKIAARYGTTVSALQRANPGIKPQSLRVGQEIKLPANIASVPSASAAEPAAAATGGARYTVRAGDSLSAIAARNGTTVTALRQANSLRGDTIQVGQELVIPGGTAAASTPRNEYTPSASQARAPGTISGDASTATFEHTLRSGETLGGLAKRYGVSTEQIMAANNITDPRRIRAGQKLVIPGYRGTSGAPAAASRTPAPAATPAPATTAPAAGPEPIPETEPLPEPQPLIPADMGDAPPIPVDEPTPTP